MNEIGSLIFYILTFLTSAFLYRLYNKKDNKIYLALAFAIPLLIGGLRFNVGTDYNAYYNYFEYEKEVDLGFNIISDISRKIGDFSTMFFLYNLLTLVFAFLGLNNVEKKNRSLAYLCFLFLFYTTSFNAMRQMLAVSIIFLAYHYALNKKPIHFFLLIALAAMFHTTAIFAAIIYPLIHIKNAKGKALIGIAMFWTIFNYQNIIKFVSDMKLFEHFSMYETYTDTFEFSNSSFYIELLVLVILFLLRKKCEKYFKDYKQYLFILFIGVILLLSGFFSPYIKRIALYFTIVSPLLLSCIPEITRIDKQRNLLYFVVIVYAILRFIMSAFLLGQSDIIPYNFIQLT